MASKEKGSWPSRDDTNKTLLRRFDYQQMAVDPYHANGVSGKKRGCRVPHARAPQLAIQDNRAFRFKGRVDERLHTQEGEPVEASFAMSRP